MTTKTRKKIKHITLKTNEGTFRVKFDWDSRDKVYLVTVPSLPGVITFGHTLEKAKKMAKEVIELHCECSVEEGAVIIDDNKRLVNPKGSVVKDLPRVSPRFQ